MALRPRIERLGLRCALVLCITGIGAQLGCSEDANLSNVRPRMVLDPGAGTPLTFGEVVLMRSEADPQIIGVSNVGEGPLTISGVTIDGPGAAMFRVSSAPHVVVPGARKEIYVRFEPTMKIQAMATLHIASNDPTTPEATFPLSGPAREACALQMGPPHSRLLLGEIRKITVTASNSQECKITYLFTDQTVFPFVNPPQLPLTIPAGTSVDLSVQHAALSRQPGVPIRQVLAKESEGTEVAVSLEGEPPLAGCLTEFPRHVFFDQTPVSSTSQQHVTVTNTCAREAYVSSAIVTIGTTFYEVDTHLFPLAVPALGSVDIPITYLPFSPISDEGRLVLSTNDVAAPRFEVELSGTAAVPAVTVFPSVLDFGTVVFKNPQGPEMRSECTSNSEYMQIYNSGTAPLHVARLEVDPAGDPDFEVIGVLVDGVPQANFLAPFDVQPGKDAKISLQFAPVRNMPPEHQSTLSIFHNADNSPSRVTLIGKGSGDGATTDTFTQLTGPKVDILWMIDNSCSMFNEQAALIANLTQFIGYADSLNSDYQMAVITTDGHSPTAGVFQYCNPYPTIIAHDWSDEATRQMAFHCLFNVGVNGPGNEAGLAASMKALQHAQEMDQDPITNRNAGFLRENAKLVMVEISDEDDQSDEGDALLRDYFLSVKGSTHPERVRMHAIAGPVAGPCESGPSQAEPGFRYFWMSQQLGGQFESICQEDWQPLLQRLGIETFTPIDEWELSQAADPGSIMVTVDGMTPPISMTDGFTYDPSSNSVKFFGSWIPTPGAQITVDYTGLCRP